MKLEVHLWAIKCSPPDGEPYFAAHATALAIWKDKWQADNFAQKLQPQFAGTVEVVRVQVQVTRMFDSRSKNANGGNAESE